MLERLAASSWGDHTQFVSLSLGYQARRLWYFSALGKRFPHALFRTSLDPWLERERSEYGRPEFPREGIGCWHPVFPARADDIWLLAAAATKQLEASVSVNAQGRREGGGLVVFEQQVTQGGVFLGLRRLVGDDATE